MPRPTSDENREHFMKRCIPMLISEGRKQDQAAAVCSSLWENRNKGFNMDKQLYGLTEVKSVKEEDRVIEFVATQEIVDYDGDIVSVEKMDISPIKNTKSFLWSHRNADPPVGKILSVKKDGKQIVGRAQMTSEEEYPFGYTIYKLIKGGYINNVSVSFIPDYSKVEYKEKDGKQIRMINESKLIEVSAVNIGANPRALITGKSMKDTFEKAWNDGVLDGSELQELQSKIDVMESTVNIEEDLKTQLKTLQKEIDELKLKLQEKELDEETSIYDELFEEFGKQEEKPKDDLNELLENVLNETN